MMTALALPLAVDCPAFAGEVGGEMLRVDLDQLPDANRDEHAIGAGWIVTEAATGQRLAVSSPDVFLWHFGGLRYLNFNRQPRDRTGEVYAHLFNNAWQTNFRAWIDGDLTYRLLLRPLNPEDRPSECLQTLTTLW